MQRRTTWGLMQRRPALSSCPSTQQMGKSGEKDREREKRREIVESLLYCLSLLKRFHHQYHLQQLTASSNSTKNCGCGSKSGVDRTNFRRRDMLQQTPPRKMTRMHFAAGKRIEWFSLTLKIRKCFKEFSLHWIQNVFHSMLVTVICHHCLLLSLLFSCIRYCHEIDLRLFFLQ